MYIDNVIHALTLLREGKKITQEGSTYYLHIHEGKLIERDSNGVCVGHNDYSIHILDTKRPWIEYKEPRKYYTFEEAVNRMKDCGKIMTYGAASRYKWGNNRIETQMSMGAIITPDKFNAKWYDVDNC